MKYVTSLVFILALLWWVLSGYTKPLLLSLGAVSIAFTAFMSSRMRVVDEETVPVHVSFKLIRLWGQLLWDIVKGNVMVAGIILGFNRDYHPRIVRGPVRQKSELGRVILANSITISPGAVTLDIRENYVEAHAVNDKAAYDIEHGILDRWVSGGLGDGT